MSAIIGRCMRPVRSSVRALSTRQFSVPSNTATNTVPIPLDVELPGIPQLKPAKNLPPAVLQQSTLPNGLRVVSQETYGQVACAALFVDGGSMYETDSSLGACHFLESTAFRGSEGLSADDITNYSQTHGISTSALFNKEVIMYKVDCLRGKMDAALGLLSQAVLAPAFSATSIYQAAQAIAFQREEALAQPQLLVSEHLFTAAYGEGTPLGRPEKCPEEAIPAVTPQMLADYHATHYVAPRMVLSVVGVDHDTAVRAAEKYFAGAKPGNPANAKAWKRPACHYIGGDVRSSPDWAAMPATAAAANAKTEYTHMMLAFPTVGWSDDDVVPVCVVDVLLGGGSSFSAGGPGKGLYSRLYREVLNGHAWVESANAFSTQLYDQGLVGVYGSTLPQHAGSLLNLLVGHLAKLTEVPVSDVELRRARNQLASSVMMNLETRGLLCEDIGRQILSHGKRLDPSELLRRIQSVTKDDLIRVTRHALSHPPALAAVGHLGTVPKYDNVRRFFENTASRFSATNPTARFRITPIASDPKQAT